MPTQAFRDAAYPQETGEAFVVLLKIESDDLVDPLYVANAGGTFDDELQTYTLIVGSITYICAPIDIIPPQQSDEEPRGKIVVPNVDQRIGEAIDAINTDVICTLTVVLESDPTVVIASHTNLYLQDVRGDALAFEGSLARPPISQEPYPKDWIRPNVFLAAYRA